MYWNLDALSAPPVFSPAVGFEDAGVSGVFVHSVPWHGHPTRFFAWYGLPDAPAGQPVPGIVLVHGGGGTAFSDWVRLWTRRGYAAIAMDTCGGIPVWNEQPYFRPEGWPRHPHSGPTGWNRSLDTLDEPIEDQWLYHATASVILAHRFLRSLPAVDPARIGLTGVSWGGVIACIAAGADSRFRFAAPVYGCGFLDDPSAAGLGLQPHPNGARWCSTWDPRLFLPAAQCPFLWVTGTNDFAFPLNSLFASANACGGPSAFAIRVNMPHGHGGAGERPEEIRAFADALCRPGVPWPRGPESGGEQNRAWAAFEPREGCRAELNFTRASGHWPDRVWNTCPADYDAASGRASATLPPQTTAWFFNRFDAQGVVSSEPMRTTAGN